MFTSQEGVSVDTELTILESGASTSATSGLSLDVDCRGNSFSLSGCSPDN